LTEKRIKEVEGNVRKIDEAICRLGFIDRAFESVKEKEDFVRVSDASKLVVMIGKVSPRFSVSFSLDVEKYGTIVLLS
jgi:hypothetical protein